MSVSERVINTVKRNIEKKYEVTAESRLVEDLVVDSFNKLMIIAGLEDEFSVTVEQDDFLDIVTVSDIVEKLLQKYPEAAGE